MKKTVLIVPVLLWICLLAASRWLLGADFAPFCRWYLAVGAMGAGLMPLAGRLFRAFPDRGWIFSKALAIALTGYLLWLTVTEHLVTFTGRHALILTVSVFLAVWIIFAVIKHVQWKKERHTGKGHLSRKTAVSGMRDDGGADGVFSSVITAVLFEELLFLLMFLVWTYFSGFRPEASGTEKFMDYGFMAAMMRSKTLPAEDIWYSGSPINYYYGGQYFAVFLTKLTGTAVRQTYHLARALVAAFAFVMPFSITLSLLYRRGKKSAAAGGLLSGAAVSLAGNMHYVLYGLFGKVFRLSGYEDYWFPDSTRYIGHNPPTSDQCIHEFPSYSFVLGDLHAHVVNIMFVLCVIGLLTAWILQCDRKTGSGRKIWDLIPGQIIAAGLLTGMFRWTNYWDYVIYLTVDFIFIIFAAVRYGGGRGKQSFVTAAVRMFVVWVLGALVSRPFISRFDMMVSEVAAAKDHSAFYQMAILWGLPVCTVALFILILIRRNRGKNLLRILREQNGADLISVILGICGIGLIVIPELVYVRDIYEQGYARSNTMFKLTYQAYIMFGIAMSYMITRMLFTMKKKAVRAAGTVLLALLLLTMGYFPYSVHCWFGDVTDRSRYRGLDAEAYLDTQYPEDAAAIRWLEENVQGSPVVLEANGDSYSKYCRVSAMTGLPTVLGWYVHEWLWREDVAALNRRAADVEAIYTAKNQSAAEELIRQYGIRYIFVGSCEREKYPALNEAMLAELGKVVYRGSGEEAYIIEVGSTAQ